MFNNYFKINRSTLVGKNVVEPDRPQMTTWRMRNACWIPKATNTHQDYVTLIAIPLQKWLQERASMLSYTYIARLANVTYAASPSS